jgi:ribosomal protein S18 acetylase RimI-like enzyme
VTGLDQPETAAEPDRSRPALVVRLYDEADEDAVVALWARCDLLRPWNDPRKDIARKLLVQRDLFLVALVDDVVAGTVMAGYEGHRGWIYYLGVDPAHQRRGVGRALMGEAERRLGALGCPKINLNIRHGNQTAMAFYEAIGFTEDAVVSWGKRLERDEGDI